jgi:hypothetical protein
MKQYDINQLSEVSLKSLKKDRFYFKSPLSLIDNAIRSNPTYGFSSIQNAIRYVERYKEPGVNFEVLDHKLKVVHISMRIKLEQEHIDKQEKSKKPNSFIQWLKS